MKTALVCGASGFIGRHLVRRLKGEGYWVRGTDIRDSEFGGFEGDDFYQVDLRKPNSTTIALLLHHWDEVYQLAADMGGMGWIGGGHDVEIMANSSLINLNMLNALVKARKRVGKVFFSSSACVYQDPSKLYETKVEDDVTLASCCEFEAYPAHPDSDYGWEKLYAERLYQALAREYGLRVRIARFHNIFGPEGTWRGGREKFPAAVCRKVAEASPGGAIELWGDGTQQRSFLYIDECIEGIRRLIASDFAGPVNIGSDVMVTTRYVAGAVAGISGKDLRVAYIPGPVGVRARNSDNTLIKEKLGWAPSSSLEEGLRKTYEWIAAQVDTHREAV